MRIEYEPKPIALKEYDWSASVGEVYGFGATREAAIEDLERLLRENELNSRRERRGGV